MTAGERNGKKRRTVSAKATKKIFCQSMRHVILPAQLRQTHRVCIRCMWMMTGTAQLVLDSVRLWNVLHSVARIVGACFALWKTRPLKQSLVLTPKPVDRADPQVLWYHSKFSSSSAIGFPMPHALLDEDRRFSGGGACPADFLF